MGCKPNEQEIVTTNNQEDSKSKPNLLNMKKQKVQNFNKQSFIRTIRIKKITDFYKIQKVIGTGQFGNVKKGISTFKGHTRAIKIIKKSALLGNSILKNDINKEINALRKLDHPNILKIIEALEDDFNIYIVSEFLEGGNLLDQINTKRIFSEIEILKIIKQILIALSYCHSMSYAHRDIKPENIMFENKNSLDNLKLIDFGFATFFNPQKKFCEMMGSPIYMAPEIIKGSPYNLKCDIWSTGIVMFFLITGNPPYEINTIQGLMKQIAQKEFTENDFNAFDFNHISEEAKEVLLQMLSHKEDERPSASSLLNLKWFQHEIPSRKIDPKIQREILNRLIRFKDVNVFQKAILQYLTVNTTFKEDIDKVQKLFLQLDSSLDGKLSKQELSEGIAKILGYNLHAEEIDNLFKSLDTDQNGFITHTEFISATIKHDIILNERNIQKAFDFFDKNQDGKISFSELRSAFQGELGTNTESIKNMIQDADEDQNNEISYQEFVQMMKQIFAGNHKISNEENKERSVFC